MEAFLSRALRRSRVPRHFPCTHVLRGDAPCVDPCSRSPACLCFPHSHTCCLLVRARLILRRGGLPELCLVLPQGRRNIRRLGGLQQVQIGRRWFGIHDPGHRPNGGAGICQHFRLHEPKEKEHWHERKRRRSEQYRQCRRVIPDRAIAASARKLRAGVLDRLHHCAVSTSICSWRLPARRTRRAQRVLQSASFCAIDRVERCKAVQILAKLNIPASPAPSAPPR